jgi:transcriptional regulator with XRE-family HTH domain
VATNPRDPLRVSAQFWQRDDVTLALDQRDIGHLFRLLRQHHGASQTRIGIAVEMTQSTVSLIMKGSQEVTALAVMERIAEGLAMPDDARLRLGLAPNDNPINRRTALSLGLLGALSPAALAATLQESAAEAMEFTRERDISTVGSGTLDHLQAAIIELDHAYDWRPASELFPIARFYRHRVQQLINGKHTFEEERELYAHAASLSYLLSDLTHDLGSHLAAEAHALDSYRHAKAAGHNELCAWASGALSNWSVLAGQPEKAVAAAKRGLSKAPRRSPVAARLHARAAKGYALQGNHTACVEHLDKARKRCEQLPDQAPSRFSTESSALTSYKVAEYAAYCYVQLADYPAAERNAREALAVQAWSPGAADISRIEFGIALAGLDAPDEAVEHANQALTHPRFLGATLSRARELDTMLMTRYPKTPYAHDFHEQYKLLTSQPLST